MVEGHPVPTPALVAWLLTAAELRMPVDRLAQRDQRLDERQKILHDIEPGDRRGATAFQGCLGAATGRDLWVG